MLGLTFRTDVGGNDPIMRGAPGTESRNEGNPLTLLFTLLSEQHHNIKSSQLLLQHDKN